MKIEMVIFDRKAVERMMVKRGYTAAEIANELVYSELGYATALKRGRMPKPKFIRLVKILNVDESKLLPKQEEKPDEKPVQVSMFDDTAEILAELKAIRECLEGIAVMMETRF